MSQTLVGGKNLVLALKDGTLKILNNELQEQANIQNRMPMETKDKYLVCGLQDGAIAVASGTAISFYDDDLSVA